MATSTVSFHKMLHIVHGARSSRQEFYTIGEVEGKPFLLHYLNDGLTSWTCPQFLDEKVRRRVLSRLRTEVREKNLADVGALPWVEQVYHQRADVALPKNTVGQTPAQLAERINAFLQTEWYLTSSPPFFRNAKDHGPSAHYRTRIPTAFFKLFILKNHFGGFLLHRRCMLYPCELGMANVSSVRRITVPT